MVPGLMFVIFQFVKPGCMPQSLLGNEICSMAKSKTCATSFKPHGEKWTASDGLSLRRSKLFNKVWRKSVKPRSEHGINLTRGWKSSKSASPSLRVCDLSLVVYSLLGLWLAPHTPCTRLSVCSDLAARHCFSFSLLVFGLPYVQLECCILQPLYMIPNTSSSPVFRAAYACLVLYR